MSSHRGSIAFLALVLGVMWASGFRRYESPTSQEEAPPAKPALKRTSSRASSSTRSSSPRRSSSSSSSPRRGSSRTSKGPKRKVQFAVKEDDLKCEVDAHDRCGPDGTAPAYQGSLKPKPRKPSWEQFMAGCTLTDMYTLKKGQPRKEVARSSSWCEAAKPYLHYTGSRYCCKEDKPDIKHCCDVLVMVDTAVQQARVDTVTEENMEKASKERDTNKSSDEYKTFEAELEVDWAGHKRRRKEWETNKKNIAFQKKLEDEWEDLEKKRKALEEHNPPKEVEDEESRKTKFIEETTKPRFLEDIWNVYQARPWKQYKQNVLDQGRAVEHYKDYRKKHCQSSTPRDDNSFLKVLSMFACGA